MITTQTKQKVNVGYGIFTQFRLLVIIDKPHEMQFFGKNA